MKVIIESGHGDDGDERSNVGVGIISRPDHCAQEATAEAYMIARLLEYLSRQMLHAWHQDRPDNSGPHSTMNGSLHTKRLGPSHFQDPTNPQRTTLTRGGQHGKEGRMCEM